MSNTNSQHRMVRDAHVTIFPRKNEKKQLQAHAVINGGEFEHTFSHKSRVSKHLEMMEPKMLAERLTGGSFFFVENNLIDFRDGQYAGFAHSDETINIFMDILGYRHKTNLKQLTHRQKSDDEMDAPIVLSADWDRNEIVVPGYQNDGTTFSSILSFEWNPFTRHINSAFDLVRLICTNGMVGVTSFLNTKVPLFNRWEDHLDIAAKQIQHKVERVVGDRIHQMISEPASVGELLLLEDHASKRFLATEDGDQRRRLINLMGALSPQIHLGHIYQPEIFKNSNLAAQYMGHLSRFDTWNIATEMRTYTAPTGKSSDFALDKYANQILFNDDEQDFGHAFAGRAQNRDAAFESVDKAFWGVAN